MSKNIGNMIKIVQGNIINKKGNSNIDVIVNAAKPTLMGSNQGVDGAIHVAIDNILGNNGSLNKKICEELDTSEGTIIRCERGAAITTEGYGLCNKIIHVVGIPYDAENTKLCTASCLNTLESCYYAIVNELKKNLDAKEVRIPIIGSGEYKFPFELAVKIAITSIGNALIEWKSQDEEMFEMSNLECIEFFVYDVDKNKCKQNFEYANKILKKYQTKFSEGKRVVYQNSFIAHFRYLKDILKYDRKRGYFAIARLFRILLVVSRVVFFPILCFKEIFGREDWEGRRQVVEILTILKAIAPIMFYILLRNIVPSTRKLFLERCFSFFSIYLMCDTITYLLILIFLADIQKSSANIIRSVIMLLFNYIEIANELSFLCYLYYSKKLTNFSFEKALAFGFLGQSVVKEISTRIDYMLLYLDGALKFFFLTMVWGYLFGHMRERKFKS